MVSPLPFLIVGLLVGAVAAFFLVCSHLVTKRMTAHAESLLRKGDSAEVICQQLVSEGHDAEHSTKVVAKVIHRAEIEIASDLLGQGYSQAETQEKMTAAGIGKDVMGEADLLRWCRRWRVLVVPAGLLLFVAGVIVCGVGLVIGDGPGYLAQVSKELVTLAGAAILSVGLMFLTGAFHEAF